MAVPAISAELRREVRLRLLHMHHEAGVGHIGGNLSALDILLTLYHCVLGEADSFVLAKGHAAGALYTTLWSVGRIADAELATFHRDGTRLSGHPPPAGLPDVLFATGSLGHGLGLAAGLALAKKLNGETGRIYCLTSDGEWNEGSSWESLLFARHHDLNLTLIVDANGLQGFGTTREASGLVNLRKKIESFNWPTVDVGGHDPVALAEALAPAIGPRAIVADTCKGHGVSFMEHRVEWHYLPMSPDQYRAAVAEAEAL